MRRGTRGLLHGEGPPRGITSSTALTGPLCRAPEPSRTAPARPSTPPHPRPTAETRVETALVTELHCEWGPHGGDTRAEACLRGRAGGEGVADEPGGRRGRAGGP